MSVPRHTVQDPPDLDTTAELPVLDVAAFEATQDSVEADGASIAGAASVYRGRLEQDLKAFSASLREFEERLAAQGKRSTGLESELESLRGARAAAEQRAAGFSAELTAARSALGAAEAQISELMQLLEQRESQVRSTSTHDAALATRLAEDERALARLELQLGEARAQASAQLEALQSREARRGVLDALFRELDGSANRHEDQLGELERALASSAERVRALEAELEASRGQGAELEASRRQGAELEARTQSLAAALASKNAELASLARTNQELTERVRTFTESAAESLERLKAVELDAQARAETHARELAAALARQRELEGAEAQWKREREATHGDREQRLAALEAEVGTLRAELAERATVLARAELQRAEAVSRQAAEAERVQALAARVEDIGSAAVALQEELTQKDERLRSAEGDLRVAEDAILRLEAELRAKATRMEELTKLNEDWRQTLEAARESIEERDSLIRRLEAEAAHSTVLLDNLQHSMRSLESKPGGADDAGTQAATRLLIRTESESEVVHVLGRKTSIGRTPDNDVQIDTKFVSRHHAVILSGPAYTIIEDLNSTNGVLVNGQRVMRQNLHEGDAIIVGNAQFRFSLRPAAAERRPL